MLMQKQHQCQLCMEILADDYIEQYPFPEIPCPVCGSLIEVFSYIEERIASRPIRKEERCDISLKATYDVLRISCNN